MELKYVAVLAVALVACVTDLRSRRIPNVLTFGAATAGILFHVFAPMGEGPTTAVLRWLIGVAIFFVPFALGGLGGGDVKLLGALGAWLGPSDFLGGAVYGVAGGVMAIITALASGYFRKALSNVICCWRIGGLPGFARCRSWTSTRARLRSWRMRFRFLRERWWRYG